MDDDDETPALPPVPVAEPVELDDRPTDPFNRGAARRCQCASRIDLAYAVAVVAAVQLLAAVVLHVLR